MDTKNFSAAELACPCCKETSPHVALMVVLEDVRKHFGQPVTINSGYRCERHNRAVGGAVASQHRLGTAADIVVRGVSPVRVHAYLKSRPYAGLLGLGKYGAFTHVDVRGSAARWAG